MTSRFKQLIKLATSADFELSAPESKLLNAASNGEVMRCREDGKACEYPDNAASWEKNHKIRASLIVWLCTDSEACKFLTHSGLKIHGAMIEGALDLMDINLSIPLAFCHCVLTKPLRLERARLKLLDLSGSYLDSDTIPYPPFDQPTMISLEARGIEVESDVLLCNRFKATARVSLHRAKIGGNLDCHEGVFHGHEKDALFAPHAEIKGDVFLSDRFKAFGSVKIDGSTIGGNFYCADGAFENPKGDALSANCALIRGLVVLGNGFTASGCVSLISITIGVSLDCGQGSFDNPEGTALCLQSAEVGGAVLLNNRFQSVGRVSLLGATIGGSLECQDGIFQNDSLNDAALLAIGAVIKHNVLLCKNFRSTGRVSLDRATIKGNLECHGGTFKGLTKEALTAEGTEIRGSVFLRNGFNATGPVSLLNATIGGDLNCEKAIFADYQILDNSEKCALFAQNIKIAGNVVLQNGFEAKGCVYFLGAIIGGNLICKGKFSNPGEMALDLSMVEVRKTVNLVHPFEAYGCVSLLGAFIGINLGCDGGVFSNLEGEALDAQQIQVKGSVDIKKCFKALGKVDFINATIGGDFILQKICNSSEIKLDLRGAKISILSDTKDSWPKQDKLFLDGLVYERIDVNTPDRQNVLDSKSRLEWLRLQNPDVFSTQPYEQLAKVLKSSGAEQEAIKVLIGMQEDLRKRGRLNKFEKMYNCILGVTIGHGYRPLQSVGISMFIILWGAFLFWMGSPELISPSRVGPAESSSYFRPSKPSPTLNPTNVSKNYPKFDLVVYSLDTFIPIVDFHQQEYWLPNANRGRIFWFNLTTGSWLQIYLWVHIALGWIFTTLAVAGFTGLVRPVR